MNWDEITAVLPEDHPEFQHEFSSECARSRFASVGEAEKVKG